MLNCRLLPFSDGPLISGTHHIAKRLFVAVIPFSKGPFISGKPLQIDHYVNVLSSGLPSLTARSYREPTTIAERIGWPAHIGPPPHRPSTVLFCACFQVVYRDNDPLISETHRDCQTIIQCNGSVSNDPLISGKPLLTDHYVNVPSSGLPYLTARSLREPTTIARRLGWPAHIGPPRHRPLTYSALFPSVCPSAVE